MKRVVKKASPKAEDEDIESNKEEEEEEEAQEEDKKESAAAKKKQDDESGAEGEENNDNGEKEEEEEKENENEKEEKDDVSEEEAPSGEDWALSPAGERVCYLFFLTRSSRVYFPQYSKSVLDVCYVSQLVNTISQNEICKVSSDLP